MRVQHLEHKAGIQRAFSAVPRLHNFLHFRSFGTFHFRIPRLGGKHTRHPALNWAQTAVGEDGYGLFGIDYYAGPALDLLKVNLELKDHVDPPRIHDFNAGYAIQLPEVAPHPICVEFPGLLVAFD
jgi:hypothetical protein